MRKCLFLPYLLLLALILGPTVRVYASSDLDDRIPADAPLQEPGESEEEQEEAGPELDDEATSCGQWIAVVSAPACSFAHDSIEYFAWRLVVSGLLAPRPPPANEC